MWHSVTHLAHLMSRKIRCCTTGMMQIKPHTHPLSLHHHYASSGIMHLTSSIQMLKVNYPMNQTVNVYNSLTFPDYNYHEIIAKKYGYEEILRSCFIVYCTFIDMFFTIFLFAGLWARLGKDWGGRSPHECECQFIRTGNQDSHPPDPKGRYYYYKYY